MSARPPDLARATAGRLAEVFVTFQGEGTRVGRRQVFVRLAGCAVGCRFCDTPDALRAGGTFEVRPGAGRPEFERDNPVSAADAAEIVRSVAGDHLPIDAIAVTGGEPLEQPEFLAELLPRLKPHAVLLETAGLHPDALARVIEHVDVVSMDLKMPSTARLPRSAGIADPFPLHRRFLATALAAHRETYVKVVVDSNLDRDDFDRGVALVRELAPDMPFLIQPETDRRGQLAVAFDALFDLARRASASGLRDVRVLPQVHKFLRAP